MSLYADYIKEREGYETIEDDRFFVTFKKLGDALYVRDLYIAPEHRGSRKSTSIGKMTIQLAKERGCEVLLTSVDKGTSNWERNKAMILEFGYKQISEDGDFIQFQKEINNG